MIAKKPRSLFFLIVLAGAAWASADEGGVLVCSFRGSGADAVYKISAPAGLPVQIEAPAEIASAKVGDPAAFQLRRQGRSLWVRAGRSGCRTLLSVSAAGGLFLFELSSGTGAGGEAAYHARILIRTGREAPAPQDRTGG